MYEDTKVENVAKLYKVKSGRLWGEGGGDAPPAELAPATADENKSTKT